jgi:hypothetical protein
MEAEFECPKCGGNDAYSARKQQVVGLGGLYGSRQKEVKRPFCRTCDIEMFSVKQEAATENFEILAKKILKFWPLVFVLTIVILIGGMYLGYW